MSEAPKIANVQYDESVPVMNREQIDTMLMCDDDEDASALVNELYGIFRAEGAEKTAGLDALCENRDREGLRNVVHFLAGSAGNLGLERFSLFCRGIERSLIQEDLEDFDACAKLVPQEFERSCQEFRRVMDLD